MARTWQCKSTTSEKMVTKQWLYNSYVENTIRFSNDGNMLVEELSYLD